MAYMEGSDPKEKLKSTYATALQKNWMVWPAVQAINFKLVPLEHRVLVVNIVSLGECDWVAQRNGRADAIIRLELLPKLYQQQEELKYERLHGGVESCMGASALSVGPGSRAFEHYIEVHERSSD